MPRVAREVPAERPGVGKYYQVLHLPGPTIFWTMGWPLNYSSGAPCTILINRKPQHLPTDRPW